MNSTPKFKIGDNVCLLPDSGTIYTIIRIQSNQYGYPVYELSQSITGVSEQDIVLANIKK